MKIIVWLGNPGKEYENTRHNVGFLLVEYFRLVWGFGEWEDSKFKWLISKKVWSDIVLFRPMTYMNLSGEAVSCIVNFYKIDPKTDLIVLSDDIDMEFGKVRKREKWSHGGQNGLKDIMAKLGTDEFTRIKIGIGRDPRFEVSDWVLSKLSKEERETLEKEISATVSTLIENWIKE